MTASLSRELVGQGIRVSAIAPGMFQTDMLSNLPVNSQVTTVQYSKEKVQCVQGLYTCTTYCVLQVHCR